ncbi:response regulator transcription factor [Alicyclobacillus fastidiosus]|uniref:Response regulator transcription factor n=1 Tax=Alicyclobacillus fastidiosus TaxID=392011 RepID=A0ABY6ZL96_9BACL|nr:response regulator transcription factor [Alicyclobacillus fastidiosus]WAH42896.1 response regulator transcription factor [Alicyclobacillus fastidiosus]GMA64838.1 DNA-binding response regulator [Alicyclobacillus fastidiosus]
MRLLVVEDELELQRELVALFVQGGYQVDAVAAAFDATDRGLTMAYDCIILDYMLPDGSGIDVVSDLREGGCKTPILMLTVKNETKDRVQGLNAGADDYLGKPFAPEELMARVSALVRRAPELSDSETIECGPAKLHTRTRSMEFRGKVLELTSKEFALMECLFRHRGQVLTRDQLIARVWGPDAEVADSALDTYIYFLRKKCANIGWKRAVQTIRGRGYTLSPEE